jgi:pyridoxine 4-dehydrogenase
LDDMAEGDYRRTFPRFQPDVFDLNLRLVREVEKLAAKKGCTPGQIAINWILALSRRPDMPRMIPIPGASSPDRVRENAKRVYLSDADMADIDAILKDFAPVGERYPRAAMAWADNEK